MDRRTITSLKWESGKWHGLSKLVDDTPHFNFRTNCIDDWQPVNIDHSPEAMFTEQEVLMNRMT